MVQIKFKVNVGYSGYDFTFDCVSDAADFMAVAVKHVSEDKVANISMEVVVMDDDHFEPND